MKIDNGAGGAWTVTPRTLTGLGTSQVLSSQAFTTLAAAGSVDLRPAASIRRDVSIAVVTPNTAGAAANIAMFDGTNNVTVLSLGVNSTGGTSFVGTVAAVGAAINNTGTQTNHHMYSVADLKN